MAPGQNLEKYGDIQAVKIATQLIRVGDKVPKTDYSVSKIEVVNGDVLIYNNENKVIMLSHDEPYTLFFFPVPKSTRVSLV